MKRRLALFLGCLFVAAVTINLYPQSTEELQQQIEELNQKISNMQHTFDVLQKNIDYVLWIQKLEDVAWVDKVYIYGPPLWK